MIEWISWPHFVSKQADCATCVFHNAPGTLWNIISGAIQEVVIINSFISGIQFYFSLVNWKSVVWIVASFKCLICFQASEGFVSSYFHQWCLFNWSSWNQVTVVINLINYIRKSVKLGEASYWDLNFSKQILICKQVLGCSVSLNNSFLELSSENWLNLIKQWSALCCQRCWKFGEFHIITCAPEEWFGSKLLFTKIVNAECNIIVSEYSYSQQKTKITIYSY